jgi:cyclophilin family peptidyl-prolyl cis-trans isomerase
MEGHRPLRYRAPVPSDKRQRQRENAATRAAANRAARQRRDNRRRAIFGGLAVVAVVAIIAILINASTGSKKSSASSTTTVPPTSAAPTTAGGPTTAPAAPPPTAPPVKAGASISAPTPCPKADGSSPRASHFEKAPPNCLDAGKTYTATFNTTEGNIVVALDTTKTPMTSNNFAVLSRYHYYDGSSFDRIDQSIDIIQGGSPSTQSIADPGPGYTVPDEPASAFKTDSSGNLTGPYTYQAGDLVMARSSGPNSASAQYFFVTGPAASALNQQGTYVVFGQVTSGLSILQNIEKNLFAPCPANSQTCLGGAPSKVVLVSSITITEQ